MRAPAALAGLAALLLGCGGGPEGPAPDVSAGVVVVESPAVYDFYERATAFYQRLEGRRFNSITTFRDAGLREYFRDDLSFSDYYALLAQELVEAHFERSQPIASEILEFLVDGPGSARVRVLIGGENGLPLRWWQTGIEREDHWERLDGRWWIVPNRSKSTAG
ncbi:MAG: hypothetical protein QNK03_25380 [Myxococcota bacterium]|nr:hypothetical protein [Myxococcota bacterium]